jgi:hypothetical protein
MNNNFPGSTYDESLIEVRLWDYIDGLSKEATVIERLILENSEWKTKYAELLEVHQLMSQSELEQPSLRFTKNVMEEIARFQIAPATKKYINTRIIWGIAAFFITMIIGFLIYGIGQINWSEASDSNSSLGIDFMAVDYGRMFNNSFVNLFMMINVVLGLLLLDRFLNIKRKKRMAGQ